MGVINEDLQLNGTLSGSGQVTKAVPRSSLIQEETAIFPIPFEGLRIWDTYATLLGTSGSSDDLGLTAGAFGTGCPFVRTQDLNSAGAITQRARTTVRLPAEYVAQQNLYIRFAAGMLTSVASVSATVDVEAYLVGRDTLVSGSDLVTTSAQSINSTTLANYTFTLTPTNRAPGDVLDVRITIAANSVTASSHFAVIAAAELLAAIKG